MCLTGSARVLPPSLSLQSDHEDVCLVNFGTGLTDLIIDVKQICGLLKLISY